MGSKSGSANVSPASGTVLCDGYPMARFVGQRSGIHQWWKCVYASDGCGGKAKSDFGCTELEETLPHNHRPGAPPRQKPSTSAEAMVARKLRRRAQSIAISRRLRDKSDTSPKLKTVHTHTIKKRTVKKVKSTNVGPKREPPKVVPTCRRSGTVNRSLNNVASTSRTPSNTAVKSSCVKKRRGPRTTSGTAPDSSGNVVYRGHEMEKTRFFFDNGSWQISWRCVFWRDGCLGLAASDLKAKGFYEWHAHNHRPGEAPKNLESTNKLPKEASRIH
ncbi:hypothetical protein AAVH_19756 [Aphelenchoides avenae]|nr:hypothetical protein AAVH_19756 [Aphelenchus avenae]